MDCEGLLTGILAVKDSAFSAVCLVQTVNYMLSLTCLIFTFVFPVVFCFYFALQYILFLPLDSSLVYSGTVWSLLAGTKGCPLTFCIDNPGALMVLTLKVISAAMNYQDGLLPDEGLRPAQQKYRLTNLPSFVEYLGYCLCCGTHLAGPVFELKEYIDWIEHRGVCILSPWIWHFSYDFRFSDYRYLAHKKSVLADSLHFNF